MHQAKGLARCCVRWEGRFSMRKVIGTLVWAAAWGLLSVVAGLGPAPAGGAGLKMPPPLPTPPKPAPPSAREAPPRPDKPDPAPRETNPRDIMAYVNGQAVSMRPLHKILVTSYGRPVAQQLVGLELARQATAKKRLSVSEEEVDAEHDRTLKEMFRRLGPSDRAEEHLDRFLGQKNMSRSLWRIIMRRNALLRKLAPRDIPIPDAEIREHFARLYDRRAVVRHIQTDTLEDAQRMKELADKGADFEKLAARYSTHESGKIGGLLPPIGRSTAQLTPALRQVALAMKKIGEISNPVQAGTKWHVLKLEKIIEPEDVKYADVKAKIAASLREQRIRVFQNQMLQKLIADAKIQYVDPDLKAQEEKVRAAAPKERK